jgi:pimeloyl-ACP methyl ester carboxylesterase
MMKKHSSSSSPDLYILHGWAVDKNNQTKWQEFFDELSKLGYQAEFIGLPGLTTPLDETWQLDDYVAWLADKLSDQKAVTLLGHSFGGQLAIRFASLYPDKVKKLILVDASGQIDKRPVKKLKRNIFKVVAKVGKPFFKAPFFRKLLYKIIREQDYYQAPPSLRQTMANVIGQEVLIDAASLKIPTLIIWGDQDTATPLEFGLNYHRVIQSSHLSVVMGARHSPQFTHANQVALRVSKFLQDKELF